MKKSKSPDSSRHNISNAQKIIGLLIIVISVALGMYLMDRFPGMQANWRAGEGGPSAVVQKDKNLELVFVKDWTFPTGTRFQNYELGGLSGLAFNPQEKILFSLSDDRGGKGDPRFFRWKMSFEGQVGLELDSVQPLKNETGKTFEERKIDPEGVVWLSERSLLISSEGEQEARPHQPPRLMKFSADGRWIQEIPLPAQHWDEKRQGSFGVRNNLALEALSLDPSERWLYLGTEAALHQDGPVANFVEGSRIRIVEYDREASELQPGAQLVYEVSPIPGGAEGTNLEVGMNGLSDFLALGQRQFLVLERAYLAHRSKNIVRLYFANCLHATDVQNRENLEDQPYEPCEKRLVLDFDSVLPRLTSGHTRIDNLEGVALIREPESAKPYLMFVSDNNFRSAQASQFLLFELRGWQFE